MELSISQQAAGLCSFGALGLGLGLLYDLLRPLRYYSRGGGFYDALFCAGAGLGLFALGMRSGRPGLWETACALLCFCLYINCLSPLLLPRFLGIIEFVHKCSLFLLQSTKKLQISVKKFFTNVPD